MYTSNRRHNNTVCILCRFSRYIRKAPPVARNSGGGSGCHIMCIQHIRSAVGVKVR